jgi:hypothetical protein
MMGYPSESLPVTKDESSPEAVGSSTASNASSRVLAAECSLKGRQSGLDRIPLGKIHVAEFARIWRNRQWDQGPDSHTRNVRCIPTGETARKINELIEQRHSPFERRCAALGVGVASVSSLVRQAVFRFPPMCAGRAGKSPRLLDRLLPAAPGRSRRHAGRPACQAKGIPRRPTRHRRWSRGR